MNILVTGAGGQLGREMQIVARDSACKWFFTDVAEAYESLDITDLAAVEAYVAAHRIDAIVNCAAWTDVDGAEDPARFELVERLNAGAPENLARAMKAAGGLLVHISTDYVFGKEPYNTPCREDRTGTPTGVYGLTKLHGEEKIKQVFDGGAGAYVIIRTAWLYSEYGKNFCRTMLALTASKPSLKVVFDQVGTPTYALDLARAIALILEDYRRTGRQPLPQGAGQGQAQGQGQGPAAPWAKSGIYHFSNEGVCSWYDFTKAIQQFSHQTACQVQPCHSDEFPSPVRRPAYSVLDKTKIKETFGVEVPYWTDSLQRCIQHLTAGE